MSPEDITLREISLSQILYDPLQMRRHRVVRFADTESRMVVPGAGVGMSNYRLMGTEFQFCEMKKDLEINVGNGCPAV